MRARASDVGNLRAHIHSEVTKMLGMTERWATESQRDYEALRRQFEAEIERKSEVINLPNWRTRGRHRRVA